MPHHAPDLSPLSPWAPELAQAFVTLASDIALVLDERGVIRNVVQGKGGGEESLLPSTHDWVGRPWADTVSADTRVKIDALLSEVTSTGLARRREINHPLDEGASVAIAYTAVRLGHAGPVLAVGRDLRAIGAIQQRFLEAQREMERGYWKVRQAEARYRLLFQVATDAVLMVDAERRVILEANPAAVEMFECPLDHLLSRELPPFFLFPYRQALNDLMATVCESGQPAEIRARLAGRTSVASVAVTPLRTDDQQRLLVRVRLVDLPGAAGELSATISRLVDSASDGVLVSDPAGHVLLANPAFLRLVRLNTELDVKGRPLTDWVGISDEDFVHLLHQVRREGLAQRMASRVVTADAQMFPVEITAALLTEGDQECIGFTIHHATPAADERLEGLHAAVAELAGRIGQAPLPELLQRAALLLEQHFIGLALERTQEDPVAAARLLGIPEQRIGGASGSEPPTPETPELNDDPAFGHADLSNCEREQIHLAGCIQPHGVLLVLHGAALRIVQVSDNTQALLARPMSGLLGQPLATLDEPLSHWVAGLPPEELSEPVALPRSCELRVDGRLMPFNATVHGRQGCRVLELEPRLTGADTSCADLDPQVLMQHLSESVARFSTVTTLGALGDAVVRRLRDLTGYDRVMVYRFDPDGHGKVVAEARDPHLDTLMGHHYPASDIPQRARDLYLLNRVRVLVDVDAPAAALLPRSVPELGGELDMSHCHLRSMSPLHLQYLRNMGVTATLVISLVRQGRLWGLVACHHYQPRRLAAPLRAAVDLLGELIATRITAIESYAHTQVAIQVRRLEQRLLDATSTEGDWRVALFRNPAALLQPVDADGAVLMYDGEVLTAGEVPSTPEVRALLRWVQTRVSEGGAADGLFSCSSVARAQPSLSALTPNAAGVLAVQLSAAPGDLLVWLRKEQLQTITWAGNPHKPVVGNDPMTLSPRRSFAAWSEIVRDTARPWSDGELALARAFGRSLADIIIQVNCVRLLIAEHQLRQTRTKVADVRKALLVVDERLRVLFTSPSLFEMAGHELQAARELETLAPLIGDVPALRACLTRLAEDRRAHSQGWTLRTPAGEPVEVELRVEIVPGRDGSVLGHFMVFDDLGDARRASEARQRLNTVLERSLQRAPQAPGEAATMPDPLLGAMLASAHMAAMDVADAGSLSAVGRLLEDVDASTRRATQLYERLRRFDPIN